jgi:hypothetical protein
MRGFAAVFREAGAGLAQRHPANPLPIPSIEAPNRSCTDRVTARRSRYAPLIHASESFLAELRSRPPLRVAPPHPCVRRFGARLWDSCRKRTLSIKRRQKRPCRECRPREASEDDPERVTKELPVHDRFRCNAGHCCRNAAMTVSHRKKMHELRFAADTRGDCVPWATMLPGSTIRGWRNPRVPDCGPERAGATTETPLCSPLKERHWIVGEDARTA